MKISEIQSRTQKYVNYGSVDEASICVKRSFDTVQVKYDGWWARVVISNGVAEVYSRTGALKDTRDAEGIPDMILLGEFMRGTNRVCESDNTADVAEVVMVFDALSLPEFLWDSLPYEERHGQLEAYKEAGALPNWCLVAPNHCVSEAEALWDLAVIQGGAEGLIFRRSGDIFSDGIIGRVKRVFTMDYVVMGFNEGGGRREGMAGNLVVGLCDTTLSYKEASEIREKYAKDNPQMFGYISEYFNGTLVVPLLRVGGGFTDVEMKDQYDNFNHYIGNVIEIRGWQMFRSGAMRHPNAVRDSQGLIKWRDDKLMAECQWNEKIYSETVGG